jgi:acylphosphatase
MLDKYTIINSKDLIQKMEQLMPTWEVIVHGRVQGVGFRWFARQCAWQCGISGYAKNLADGTVKIMASGGQGGFEAFCGLLRAGNRHARVSEMDIAEMKSAENYVDFDIR